MNDILYTFPILIRGIQLREWRSVDDMVRGALLRSAEEIVPTLMEPANTPMRRQLMVNLEVLAEEPMGNRVVEVLGRLRSEQNKAVSVGS